MPEPNETTRRRRTDAASKLLFVKAVIADLLRRRLPALAAELDLDAADTVSSEYVDMDRSRRIGDSALRIPRRDGGPHVLVAAEFQHRNDRGMLDRCREYAPALAAACRQRGLVGPDEQPLVLSLVIHTGDDRWTAPDGTEALRGLPPAAAREAAPYAAWGYILEDLAPGGDPVDGPRDHFAAVARLVRCREVDELLDALADEWRRFGGREREGFRRGLWA